MIPPSRSRRIAKWTGLVMCVVILAMWAASTFFNVAWIRPPRVHSPARGYISFVAPFWMFLALAAIPTAVLWYRDRRTVKPGCCRQCGYDLRASKKTCPECGTAIAPEPR